MQLVLEASLTVNVACLLRTYRTKRHVRYTVYRLAEVGAVNCFVVNDHLYRDFKLEGLFHGGRSARHDTEPYVVRGAGLWNPTVWLQHCRFG